MRSSHYIDEQKEYNIDQNVASDKYNYVKNYIKWELHDLVVINSN